MAAPGPAPPRRFRISSGRQRAPQLELAPPREDHLLPGHRQAQLDERTIQEGMPDLARPFEQPAVHHLLGAQQHLVLLLLRDSTETLVRQGLPGRPRGELEAARERLVHPWIETFLGPRPIVAPAPEKRPRDTGEQQVRQRLVRRALPLPELAGGGAGAPGGGGG